MITDEMRKVIGEAQAAGGLNEGNMLAEFIADCTPIDIVRRYAQLPAQAREADYGEFDRNIVVLDTETTGFSLSHDELTQIAAARLERGKIVDWFITFVNPGKPIPEDVAHLTDIHDEDVADAPTPAEALTQLVAFVGDAKLVAHNADFDRSFTTKHPAGYPLLENVWLDSLDMARIALPRMKSHRLIDLVRAFGAPLSTHRADDDVAATCALYRILLAGIDAMPAALVGEISRLAPAGDWSTSAVFEHFARCNEAAAGAAGAADSSGAGADAAAATAANAAVIAGAEAPKPAAPEPFSVRSLRWRRTAQLENRAKPDAEALALDPERGLSFPTEAEVEEAFTENGLVGSLYGDYEPRVEQRAMARAVRDVFATSQNLVVEAGTGVGKSMAYLVPAALSAVRNDITIGVATKTNALLDQLVHHELPALADVLAARGVKLSYASLKGFSHYPCLRRVERLAAEGAKMRTVGNKELSQAPALAGLLSYIEQTEYDDTASLKVDHRLVPRAAITTTSHDCLRRKCPFYGTSCFVHGARRRAEASHIVVTNHSMLFCDVAADGGLLPPIRYWVVDEAHGAESEARRALSLELAAENIRLLAARVAAAESARNVFTRAERAAGGQVEAAASTLFYALTAKAHAAGAAFATSSAEFNTRMRDLLYFDDKKRGKGYETVELWLNDGVRASERFRGMAAFGKTMVHDAEKLIGACQDLVAFLEDVPSAATAQREIAAVALELKDLVRAAEVILFACPETYVYAATLNKKGDKPIDKLEAMLLNVGSTLNETLYAHTHSVVYASATLAVGDSFDAFEDAMGLNQGEFSGVRELKLNSSYDFDRQMTVYVVSDIPEPNEFSYLPALQKLLTGAHLAQRGSMLTLFTNRKEMERCFDEVQPALKQDDLRLVCQKWGVSVKGLRDDFLADEHLSLFALKSFWEGFDAPGATLKGVIIPKLPFAKPTDPLSCERAARDDQAWRRYVLPAAVLETKQAAGRLIRKADDYGALILADRRLLTKSYGKAFLNSLPSRNIQVLTAAEIVEELRKDAQRAE